MLARTLFDDEHHQFRDAVRRFFAAELTPNIARWEAQGQVDKSFWRACGEQGVLCPDMPEAYGFLEWSHRNVDRDARLNGERFFAGMVLRY